MSIEELKTVRDRLWLSYERLYSAKRTIDKRSRDKRIRNEKVAIAEYATMLPSEVKVAFEDKVGANPLSYQHSDDIGQCIGIIDEWIRQLD